MSLEQDVTDIKKLAEAKPVFKAATPEEVDARPVDRHFKSMRAAEKHRGPSLELKGDSDEGEDYILKGVRAWIEIDNLVVEVLRSGDGVSVAIMTNGDEAEGEIASTSANFSDAAELR